MKIIDAVLLDAIWKNQLRLTAKGHVSHYINGTFGLQWGNECSDDSWKAHGISERKSSRERVTSKVGPDHLLKRLRALISGGLIGTDTGDSKSFSIFYIDTPKAREAWEFSCKFWRNKGLSDKAGNATRLGNFQVLKAECELVLISHFSQHDKLAA